MVYESMQLSRLRAKRTRASRKQCPQILAHSNSVFCLTPYRAAKPDGRQQSVQGPLQGEALSGSYQEALHHLSNDQTFDRDNLDALLALLLPEFAF